MKRIVVYAAVVVLLLGAPVEKLDVAKLEPVDVVYVFEEAGKTVLVTDTDARGEGEDSLSALQDLKERTPGVVYLDTARYLLVTSGTLDQIDLLRAQLHGRLKLCMAQNIDVKEAARFLDVHGKLPRLRQWKKGQNLPLWDGEKIIEKT